MITHDGAKTIHQHLPTRQQPPLVPVSSLVGCHANARVSVENVRFEILTYIIWALLSGEGPSERRNRAFEQDLLLPFLATP